MSVILGQEAIDRLRHDGVSPNQIRGATVEPEGEVILGHQGEILAIPWCELRYVIADALTGLVPLRGRDRL